VIANVEEAAIGFSGRISRNGLLPWPEPVKEIVEGDQTARCNATLFGDYAIGPLN
jgi:hypothetical protein